MKRIIFTLCLMSFVTGCGSEGECEGFEWCEQTQCTVESQNNFVQEVLLDDYLWADSITATNVDNFSSPEAVIDYHRYKEGDRTIDKWSYMTSSESYSQLFDEGQFVGVGFRTDWSDTEIRVSLVYPNSPAEVSGIKRGDYILSVNGVETAELINGGWTTAWGASEVGISARLELQTPGEEPREFTVQKGLVTMDTTPVVTTIESSVGTVGYIHFTSFLAPSYTHLTSAFDEIKEAGATELILDLRYNGGGRLNIAALLGSLIAGSTYANEAFTTLEFNDENANRNVRYEFFENDSAMALNQVTVLTTDGSCSASESVISGLEPFIDVTLVGGTTCGKPVGMTPIAPEQLCGNVLAAINFRGVNANGFTDFFDGLPADCAAEDDLDNQLGTADEAMVAAALTRIETGECPVSLQAQSVRKPVKSKNVYTGWKRIVGAE